MVDGEKFALALSSHTDLTCHYFVGKTYEVQTAAKYPCPNISSIISLRGFSNSQFSDTEIIQDATKNCGLMMGALVEGG